MQFLIYSLSLYAAKCIVADSCTFFFSVTTDWVYVKSIFYAHGHTDPCEIVDKQLSKEKNCKKKGLSSTAFRLLAMSFKTFDDFSFKYQEKYSFIRVFEEQVAKYADNTYTHVQIPNTNDFRQLTYSQVNKLANLLAGKLSASLEGEETVGFIADHTIYYLITMLALLKLRKTFMALSPRNSQAANVNLLNKTGAKFIVSSSKYKEIAEASMHEAGHGCRYMELKAFDIDEWLQQDDKESQKVLDRSFSADDIEKIVLIIHRY